MIMQPVVSGGNFEDGAVTGIFSRAFNHGLHNSKSRLFGKWLGGNGNNEQYTQEEFDHIKGAVKSGVATTIEGDAGTWDGGTYQGYDFTGDSTLADSVGKGYVTFDHDLNVVGASDYYDFNYPYTLINTFKIFGAEDYYISYGPKVCVPTHQSQGYCN